MFDGSLELLDILSASFPESCLSLTVPLLPLLRCCIDLSPRRCRQFSLSCLGCAAEHHTGFLPPFRFCTWAFSWIEACSSASISGDESTDENEPSRECSTFGIVGESSASTFDISEYSCRSVPPSNQPTTLVSKYGARVRCRSSRALDSHRWGGTVENTAFPSRSHHQMCHGQRNTERNGPKH